MKVDNKGFTLVEVMIGAGLLAVVGYFFMMSMTNQAQNSSRAKKQSVSRKLIDDLSEFLDSELTCSASLKGKTKGSLVDKIVHSKKGITLFEIKKELVGYPGISIDEIKIDDIYSKNNETFIILNVKLNQKNFKQNQKEDRELERRIILKAMVDNNVIVNCSRTFLEEDSKMKNCNEVGGTYMPAKNGVPAFCDEKFNEENCVAAGGIFNQGTKKCTKSTKSMCDDLGGKWINNKCEL